MNYIASEEEKREKKKEYDRKRYNTQKERLRELNKIWYKNNPEKVSKIRADWKEKHPNYNKEYRSENASKIRDNKKAYYLKNKDVIKEKRLSNLDFWKNREKTYYINNIEKRKEKNRKFREANRSYAVSWRKANKEKICFYSNKYRLTKIGATPSWLSKEQLEEIKGFYELAKECEMLTGDNYHVDHIVPLQGENVCGLHVPWNLQVLPAEVNLRKSNRFKCGGSDE